MFLAWIAAAWAGCPSTSADLLFSMEAAEAAFADMDTAAFLAATNRATAEANCLGESVPRSAIARLHRVEGLRAFVDKDTTRAAQAFAAARAIEPSYAFPEALVPAEHPVRAHYTAVDPASATTTSAPVPTSGYLTFDGRNTTSRPSDRPSLAQLVGDDGAISQSRYLWGDDPLFTYASRAAPAVSTTTDPGGATARTERKGPNLPLTIATGAAVVAAGATWFVAKGAHDAYYDTGTAPGELDALRGRTNLMFTLSAGTGVAALGLGVGAVVAGHW